MKIETKCQRVDGNLRALSAGCRSERAPGGRVSPQATFRWWVAVAMTAVTAVAVEITLPIETSRLVESPLPGYALTVAHCYTCHSTEYVRFQPSSSPRAYWKATVTKMQKTFGAPIPDEVVEPITDYLVKTYGAERAPASGPQKDRTAPGK